MTIDKALALFLLTVGSALCAQGAEPADSVSSMAVELEGFTVTATAPRRVLVTSPEGVVTIDPRFLGEQVSFMGSNDPLALVRSLPSVATVNDLQARMPVRGGSTGENLFESDGARVVNPLHMLGLFSAYNPAYYSGYTFIPGRIPATIRSLTSAYFGADSGMQPDSVCSGSVSAGLIESHGAMRVPVVPGRLSVAAGVRHTYLDAVFPRLLRLGSSLLKYGFTDVNASVTAAPGRGHLLKLSFFGNCDRMNVDDDRNGSKDGRMGWRNAAASVKWRYGAVGASMAWSGYSNTFSISEGGRRIDCPSWLSQFTAGAEASVGSVEIEADVSSRRVSGQNGFCRAASWEADVAADWRVALGRRVSLRAGMRAAAYFNGGYTAFRPQPRLEVEVALDHGLAVYAGASRRVRFDRLVEETTAGLPADFWMCASADVAPLDVWGVQAGVSGVIPSAGVHFAAEAYGRLVRADGEFAGSLIDLSSPDYNPASDLMFGKGYAAGVSVSLVRQTGRLRGRAAYAWGVSRRRFDRYGDSYFPSAHDRPHDLSVSLSYDLLRRLTVAASFVYAAGTPYTRAKYGYMIGENLICEYFPHNSSRLPAYRRLDLAATWRPETRGRLGHSFNVSVYNVCAFRNILFRYTSYSVTDGIRQRQSVMDMVIPSVSYTLTF